MVNHTASFYNRFSILYPIVDFFLKPQKRILMKEINNLPDGKLLEIGVGNGSHLPFYNKHSITGIDTSSKMLAAAKKKVDANVHLLKMNGEDLLFANETFDYVVISHVIAVVENPEQLIDQVLRVLKPNGKVFILNHFTPDNPLKYFDRTFGFVSEKFHFRSVFYIKNLQSIKQLNLLKEIELGAFSYFKLLILQKP